MVLKALKAQHRLSSSRGIHGITTQLQQIEKKLKIKRDSVIGTSRTLSLPLTLYLSLVLALCTPLALPHAVAGHSLKIPLK